MASIEKASLLQGTLDLLILKIVALGPVRRVPHCFRHCAPARLEPMDVLREE